MQVADMIKSDGKSAVKRCDDLQNFINREQDTSHFISHEFLDMIGIDGNLDLFELDELKQITNLANSLSQFNK
jgi:hypothetical protein